MLDELGNLVWYVITNDRKERMNLTVFKILEKLKLSGFELIQI